MNSLALKIAFFSVCLVASPTLFAQSGTFPGDYDGDGIITLTDFATLHGCFAGPSTVPTSPECAAGDFDLDGSIDLSDVRSFNVQFDAQQCEDWLYSVEYLEFFNPESIVVTDMNNDSISDIVVGGAGSPLEFGVLLGLGDGAFSAFQSYGNGIIYVLLEANDFDNDGNMDIAAGGAPNPNFVTIYFGTGSGNVANSISYPTSCGNPYRVLSMDSGDINGDGLPDIVMCNNENRLVSLINLGDRTFDDLICIQPLSPCLNFQLGDFSGDGLSDVVRRDELFLGDGSGYFSPFAVFEPIHQVSVVVVGDVVGDGFLDIVAGNSSDLSIVTHMGNGDGTFQASTPYLLPNYGAGQGHKGMALFDANHDDRLDVAVGLGNKVMILLGGESDSYFETPSFDPIIYQGVHHPRIAAGEIHGDENSDLIVATRQDDAIALFRGRGDGSFDVPPKYPIPGSARDFAVGDLDQDGNPDVITLGEQTIAVLKGSESGTLTLVASFEAVGAGTGRLVLDDVNSDGDPDLLVISRGGGSLNIFHGKEQLSFDDVILYPIDLDAVALATSDFNQDGFVDVALAEDEHVRIVQGSAAGFQGPDIVFEAENDLSDLVAGDFNHDGRSDLALLLYSTIQVLSGNGDGTFDQVAIVPTAISSDEMAIGDVDADGHLDLIVGRLTSVKVHYGLGDGTFETPPAISTTYGNHGSVVADVDGDGRNDLVQVADDGAAVHYGIGGRQFQPVSLVNFFDLYSSEQGVKVVDMNRDERLDLVILNGSSIRIALSHCAP